MQVLNLLNTPNQSFVTTQNGVRFEICIVQCNGNMCVDLTMNGTAILTACRLVGGTPLVPFGWMTQGNGNFLFVCQDENCIDYSLFNITQFLYYLSEVELEAFAMSPPSTWTLNAAQQAAFPAASLVVPTGYLPLP